MANGEPVKDFHGLGTNEMESKEERFRGEDTDEQYIRRHVEPQQEASTTREPANVGTLTSTTAAAQATTIRLPSAEASAGASQPQTTPTASTSPRPPLQRPPSPRFSSSREPADVAIMTQTTEVAPLIRIPIATSPTRATPLNRVAAPFVPASNSSPGSAATSTHSQRTTAPTITGPVSSSITIPASDGADSSTSTAQPVPNVSNGSWNTATLDPMISNLPSNNANQVSDTSETGREQLIDVSRQTSDVPPIVPPRTPHP